MKTGNVFLALAVASLLGAAGYGLYRVGMNRGMKMADPAPRAAPAVGGLQATARYRQESPLLARPDGAGTEVRQARQVALHGHAAGSGLRRRRWRRRQGHDQPARAAEPGRAYGRGNEGHAGNSGRSGGYRRLQRARSWRSCRRAATASSRSCTYGRRSTPCARVSRWPNCMSPNGSRRRKNISPCEAHGRHPTGSAAWMAPVNACVWWA